MKSITVMHRYWMLVIVFMMIGSLISACSSEPATTTAGTTDTESDSSSITATQTTRPTQEPTVVPDQPAVFADTLPCSATIIESSQSRLNIRYREPTSDESLNIGALRPGTPVLLDEMQEVDGIVWYEPVLNNISQGWVQARWIVLGDDCVTATNADSSTSDENSEVEATEEATQEASD